MARTGKQKQIKTQRTMRFNLPERIMDRIEQRQIAHSERMDRSRAETKSNQLMTAGAKKNALMTAERVSAPGYQEGIRERERAGKLDIQREKSRGDLAYGKIKNEGALANTRLEHENAMNLGRATGDIPPLEEEKPDIMSIKNEDFFQGGSARLEPSTDKGGSFDKDVSRLDKPILPGANTNLGRLLGSPFSYGDIDLGLRKSLKFGRDYLMKPLRRGTNWLMSGN